MGSIHPPIVQGLSDDAWGVWAAGWDIVSWKPSAGWPAAQQFTDAFHIMQADLSQILTFTKCRQGDNLIEPLIFCPETT